MSIGRIRVIIRPSFALYMAAVALFSSVQRCLCVAAALLAHESAHLAVSLLLKEPVSSIEIAPFGGVMTYSKSPSKGVKGVLVAAAGPLGNYGLILLLVSLPELQQHLNDEMIRQMLSANLTMILLNCLPALPLDGGNLLFSLGYYLFNVSGLIGGLCAAGTAVGAAMIALGLYGLIHWQILNVSLLVVGGYLIVWARRSRAGLMAQNLYAIVQERANQPTGAVRMSAYRIPADMRLYQLMEPIMRVKAAVFFVDLPSGQSMMLNEAEVCRALLQDASLPVGELAEMQGKENEKNSRKTRFPP